jgi:hypothetical protein
MPITRHEYGHEHKKEPGDEQRRHRSDALQEQSREEQARWPEHTRKEPTGADDPPAQFFGNEREPIAEVGHVLNRVGQTYAKFYPAHQQRQWHQCVERPAESKHPATKQDGLPDRRFSRQGASSEPTIEPIPPQAKMQPMIKGVAPRC